MVAGRECDDAARQIGRRNREYKIGGPADFERSPKLEVLALVGDSAPVQNRRAECQGTDALRRLTHHFRVDAEVHLAGRLDLQTNLSVVPEPVLILLKERA